MRKTAVIACTACSRGGRTAMVRSGSLLTTKLTNMRSKRARKMMAAETAVCPACLFVRFCRHWPSDKAKMA